MKKAMKRFFATLLAATMVIGSLSLTAFAADDDAEYTLFIAYGGDAAESNDWGYSYAGPDTAGNTDGIEAVTETIKVGETKTVSITLPSECVYTWYMAPVLLAENVEDLDVTVEVKVDGADVTIDDAAGDAWWYEGTGDYADTQAIRLMGGYNEWGAQYIESPVFTTIEYTVTLNAITIGDGTSNVNAVESTEEYPVFIAFGGDLAEENDWALSYAGGDASEGITATDATIKSGETATVKLEFAEPVVNAWYFAPTMIAENVVEADFTVKVLIDGEEVEVDMTAGDNWWYEGTGDYPDTQAVRIAGGFNEWGAQYIAEPAGFTTLEFEITANTIKVGEAAEAEAATSAAGDVDLDGTYHAYLGIQSPTYSFRNAWNDSYGMDYDDGTGIDYFNQVTGWDADNNAVTRAGSFADAEITGNGTYTVSVTGLDLTGDFDSQDYFNLIFVDTDIPNTGAITISDMTLTVDGRSVEINPIISPDSVDYLTMLIQNTWNEDVATIGYYAVPPTEMIVTFTVSGFNYDNAAADEAPAADDAAPAEETVEEPSGNNTGLIVGIVVAVVAACGIGAGVVISKKKKAE